MGNPFCIVGPTGVGKSELAAEVAARAGAEIVGADAFQVYAGLPLLSAKPDPATLARAPHHLIGEVSPKEEYNVARYLAAATNRLGAIAARERQALVVGGSGMYVKALTHGLSPLPPADLILRAELEALDLDALNARLEKLDPPASAFIDRKNKRRVVRALEVCLTSGRRFSDAREQWAHAPSARGVFLFREKDDLHRRIEQRVNAIFRAGVVEEVRAATDLALSSTARMMIGLEAIQLLLAGRLRETECRERIALETRQYAKRQLTWFKRERHFSPLNLTGLTADNAVEQITRELQTANRA